MLHGSFVTTQRRWLFQVKKAWGAEAPHAFLLVKNRYFFSFLDTGPWKAGSEPESGRATLVRPGTWVGRLSVRLMNSTAF